MRGAFLAKCLILLSATAGAVEALDADVLFKGSVPCAVGYGADAPKIVRWRNCGSGAEEYARPPYHFRRGKDCSEAGIIDSQTASMLFPDDNLLSTLTYKADGLIFEVDYKGRKIRLAKSNNGLTPSDQFLNLLSLAVGWQNALDSTHASFFLQSAKSFFLNADLSFLNDTGDVQEACTLLLNALRSGDAGTTLQDVVSPAHSILLNMATLRSSRLPVPNLGQGGAAANVIYGESASESSGSTFSLPVGSGSQAFRLVGLGAGKMSRVVVDQDVIAGGSQKLDAISWKDTTFSNTIILYDGGPLRLTNVTFLNCKFEILSSQVGNQLLVASAVDPASVTQSSGSTVASL